MSKLQCPMNVQVPMSKMRRRGVWIPRGLFAFGIWALGIYWALGFGHWEFLLADEPRPSVLVVVGAEGTVEFGQQFGEWATRWREATKRGNAEFVAIGLDDSDAETDRERLKKRLSAAAGAGDSRHVSDDSRRKEPLWLILIGHGTFDGKVARFNLRGPDVSAAELAEWLKPIKRPVAIINCASSSGPFLNELSGPNRVVITATKSGHEYNFAHFGDFLSATMSDPQADLDKDEQTSLLEAFLLASSRVREFYASEGRLMTEHALLDDNGDRLGTPADWFQGVRAIKSAKDGASVEGLRASQLHLVRSRREEQLSADVRARRDELEQDLAQLRQRKTQLAEDEYLQLIEPLLLELSKLYEGATERFGSHGDDSP
jgi:DNA-binding transcriptional MerR regulator